MQKGIWQTSALIYDKSLNKAVTEGTSFNISKAIHDKPTANITLNGEKLKAFSLMSGIRMRTLATSIQYSIQSPSQAIGEELKGIRVGK